MPKSNPYSLLLLTMMCPNRARGTPHFWKYIFDDQTVKRCWNMQLQEPESICSDRCQLAV